MRTQTPSVSGTRKNASSASVCRGVRRSAKNSRLKLLARARTLATEATTPSFTSSVIRMSLSVTPQMYRAQVHLIELARQATDQIANRTAPSGAGLYLRIERARG